MGITSFGWSRPAISRHPAAHGYYRSSTSKRLYGSDVNLNNDLPKTSLGLQGVGRGGGGGCSSCASESEIMSGFGGKENLSIGSCVLQKPGYGSSTFCDGVDERFGGVVMASGGFQQRHGDSRSKLYGAGGVNRSCVVGVRHHKSGPKFGSIGVATGQKMAIASARINEKLAHFSADWRHNFFCAMHPRVVRLAAKESNIATKSVATATRRQKEAKAREVANKKPALVRKQQAWQSHQPAHQF